MVGPWVSFVFSGAVALLKPDQEDNMSDIQYLAIKEFDGKLRSDEGFLSAPGDLATLTANTGKDMYLARAQITYFGNKTAGSSIADQVVLKINGTIVETSKATLANTTSAIQTTFTYEFKNIGQKVAAAQIIKLEVITLDVDTDVEGMIECFEEDTGATPRLAAQSVGNVTVTAGLEGADIGFLAKKEFDGKLRTNEGIVTTTGDLATLTATAGKDMYLARAKISASNPDTTQARFTLKVELTLNGIVIETCIAEAVIATAAQYYVDYEFKVGIGQKVAATQIIKLAVTTNDSNTWVIEGAISCIEEDTGASPV